MKRLNISREFDELDYSSLPFFKRKLKKLRKQNHVAKPANASGDVEANFPYIMEID